VHLSTSHYGGAGIAARRLHQALLKSGLNSFLVTLERRSYVPQDAEVAVRRTFRTKILSFLNSTFSKVISNEAYFTIFSVPAIKYNSLKEFGTPENTIFHVHNWFNLINLRILRKLLKDGFRLAFTLHDQRLFTGGCHYSLECNKYMVNCSSCPKLPFLINKITRWNLNKLKKIFREHNESITIIAPSIWIETLGRNSYALKDIDIFHVSNTHSNFEKADVFLFNRKEIKPGRRIILGVASTQKNSLIKGSRLLDEIAQTMKTKGINAEIVFLVDISTKGQSSEYFWSQIDYLLVTSVADNSPNVIHEAKLLGIPVIATNVGGIPELLNLEYDYLIQVNGHELDQFEIIIKKIIANPVFIEPKLIMNNYKFRSEKSINLLIRLYESMLAK
jgi:glycosyltransferase involved in cell wall biosynthesis